MTYSFWEKLTYSVQNSVSVPWALLPDNFTLTSLNVPAKENYMMAKMLTLTSFEIEFIDIKGTVHTNEHINVNML